MKEKTLSNLQEGDDSFNNDATRGGVPELLRSRVSPAPIIDCRADCIYDAKNKQDAKVERDLNVTQLDNRHA